MYRRSSSGTHGQGEIIARVDSSHGVRLDGGSTGGIVEPFGDDTHISLRVRAKGTGTVIVGDSSGAMTLQASTLALASSQVTIGSTASSIVVGNSTSYLTAIQRYLVAWTVPALSSGASAETTVTVTGLTTNSVLVLSERAIVNSTVTGVTIHPRCSTANELVIIQNNVSASSLGGSTQSAYLLQFRF